MYPSGRKYCDKSHSRCNNRRRAAPIGDSIDWQAPRRYRPTMPYGINDFERPRMPPNRQRSRQVPYPARRPESYTPRNRDYGMRAPLKPSYEPSYTSWDDLSSFSDYDDI